MENIIIYAVVAVLVILPIIGFIVRKSRDKYNNVVYDAGSIKTLSICSIFCAGFIFILSKVAVEFDLTSALAFSSIAIIPVLAWICALNEVIVFDDECFSVKNFLGIKKKYKYENVEKMGISTIRRRMTTFTTVYFYIGKKAVKSSPTYENHKSFVNTITEKYKKAHNGQTIPLV